MIRWTDTIEVKKCSECPFFHKNENDTDEWYYCGMIIISGNMVDEITKYNKETIPDFCPLKKNNFIVRLKEDNNYKPITKTEKIKTSKKKE